MVAFPPMLLGIDTLTTSRVFTIVATRVRSWQIQKGQSTTCGSPESIMSMRRMKSMQAALPFVYLQRKKTMCSKNPATNRIR
jgi:hypothetical protein